MRLSTTGLGRLATDLLGLLPHLGALLESCPPFGLEPRVRALAALAVALEAGEPVVVTRGRALGRAAGLTEAEVEGMRDGLIGADLSAIALALGTIGRPLPDDLAVPFADECFPSEQIRQIRAVALAVNLLCSVSRTVRRV